MAAADYDQVDVKPRRSTLTPQQRERVENMHEVGPCCAVLTQQVVWHYVLHDSPPRPALDDLQYEMPTDQF